MKFEIGWIVVIASVVIFYLRLIQIRGRRRQETRQAELAQLKAQARRKPNQPPPRKVERPTFQIGSWYLLAIGAVLMLFGLALRTTPTLLPAYQTYWWVATSIGVLVFTFGLK